MRLNCFATHLGKDLPKTKQLVVFEPLEPLMTDYLGRSIMNAKGFTIAFPLGQ